MRVYRYREAAAYNIEALESDSINGSLFKKYNDGTELNFDISNAVSKRYKITPEEKKKFIALLVKNIRERYYLACFTIVSPKSKNCMWRRYAKQGNGYCLEYETEDIRSAIELQVFDAGTISPVKYCFNPFCLDPVITFICSRSNGVRKELENGDVDAAMAKTTEAVKKHIMESFLHKPVTCGREGEIRLILQSSCPTDKDLPVFNPSMLYVKPRRITISNAINVFDKKRLIDYANKKGIPYEIIENPCK